MPPKRRKSRRSRGFVAIPFFTEITLSTLAQNTALAQALLTLGEDLYALSIDCLWSLKGLTPGEGPVSVGFAHGDLTVAEITETLDASVSDPDDIIAKERARRPVRRAGLFSGIAATENLNNGVPVRTKLRFSVGDGHSINAFAVNRSGAAPLTTGGIVVLAGTIYGRWQR